MAIIGRKKEIRELKELYNSGEAELVAVYGRRRVGKTYLIDQSLEGKFSFRHAGLSPIETEQEKNNGAKRVNVLKLQLKHFYMSLLKQGLRKSHQPESWFEAFYMLEELLELKDKAGKRQLVFLDELPWMDTPRSNFMMAFAGFWHPWACHRSTMMVVVCGSATSWIQDNFINNHGGLYGRTTREIRLAPFTLGECEQFYKSRGIKWSKYDIVQSYMVMGGIPYYMKYVDKGMSLDQAVNALFFDDKARHEGEYDRL
ncbi:MAG: ATP-binding protein, partial [Bacteroidales bacterium]|nr:ATP-binding protein [Bacteroidales bacterium]